MKITVEVSEFYLDEDLNLEESLKNNVKNEVLKAIQKSIHDKVEDQITRQVKIQIEKKLLKTIDKEISANIDNGIIKQNGKEVKIVDYIKDLFQNSHGWNSPTDKIKLLSKQFGEELKARYDLTFASHIVARLNDNGMLKDGVAKLIIEDKK